MKKFSIRNAINKFVVAERLTQKEIESFIHKEAKEKNCGVYRRWCSHNGGTFYDIGLITYETLPE